MIIPRTFNDFSSTYSKFSEIPENRRLNNYEEAFEDKDTWEKYIQDQYLSENYSKSHLRIVNRAGENWKRFCQDQCHHALATPAIINRWCMDISSGMKKTSAQKNYIIYLNNFYRYLMWHVEYPHWYNPVQFAVESYEPIKGVWNTDPWEDDDV